MVIIDNHIEDLTAACTAAKVERLYAFGSVLGDRFTEDSDLDFIVAIDVEDPLEYTERYFQLKFELERIFDREIDLLEEKALHNELFKEMIDREKVLIYARRSESLA